MRKLKKTLTMVTYQIFCYNEESNENFYVIKTTKKRTTPEKEIEDLHGLFNSKLLPIKFTRVEEETITYSLSIKNFVDAAKREMQTEEYELSTKNFVSTAEREAHENEKQED